jgi:hypothetical protein
MAFENDRSTISAASSFRLIKPERKYRSIVFCSSVTTPSSIGAIRICDRSGLKRELLAGDQVSPGRFDPKKRQVA